MPRVAFQGRRIIRAPALLFFEKKKVGKEKPLLEIPDPDS